MILNSPEVLQAAILLHFLVIAPTGPPGVSRAHRGLFWLAFPHFSNKPLGLGRL